MELYLYVVLFFGICLVHGLCRAFYDAGKEKGAKYVIILPEGLGKFRIVPSPYMPAQDIEKWMTQEILKEVELKKVDTRPYILSDMVS